ncbi:RNA-binding protein [methanogenic archaeon mixed culture ISO4-G1]|nr:RNA-binding protein [methanogenic archaeon mixed culture ISO4-G1]
MQVTFHWVRVQTFCYATEKQDLIEDTLKELLGDIEFEEEISESEHGNSMMILEARITKQREFADLFSKLGDGILDFILEDIDNRVDEDDMFYLRLDKQKAVQGIYEVAHHGDVISIFGKVQAHPAKKEAAIRVLKEFIQSLQARNRS